MTKAKKEKKIWTIGVEAESTCYNNNDSSDSDEPYSYRGTTSTSWDIQGLRLVDEEDKNRYCFHERVQVVFKPEKGKIYHLLFAIYSTGDSFGHDDGRCFEIVGVYKDRKVAELNEKRLREGKPEKKGLVRLKVEGLTETHDYYRPWTGYFESLDRLDVESFVLN